VRADGLGQVERIISAEPVDHPLRDAAIRHASQESQFERQAAETRFVDTIPYCQAPRVTSQRFGDCP
jgi:hypothetical protein